MESLGDCFTLRKCASCHDQPLPNYDWACVLNPAPPGPGVCQPFHDPPQLLAYVMVYHATSFAFV